MPSRWRRLPHAVGLCIALVALVACQNNGGDATTTPDPPAGGETASIPAGAYVIDQVALEFIPAELEVPLGEDVHFKNSERIPHTITIDGENVSGAMGEGEVITWSPATPGVYQVTCDFHPNMRAAIVVTSD